MMRFGTFKNFGPGNPDQSVEPGMAFFASCIDGDRIQVLAGPFATHEEALAIVDRARDAAYASGDPKAWFYSYGTARASDQKCGILNDQLGVAISVSKPHREMYYESRSFAD